MEWYIRVLENYAVFDGRARRKEYWMFVLMNFFVCIGIGLIEGLLGLGQILGTLYGLAIFIPTLAVSVRRLHDSGRTGWWILVGFVPLLGTLVLLLFFCFEGDSGSNEYGVDPISG